MKYIDIIKKEFSGYNFFEILFFIFILTFILFQILILKDNKIAGISAFCGIMYSFIAGKGKISCYFFGLMGSFCYSYISFKNNFLGQLILYACYYIPMQTLGIFKWKNNLKKDVQEIKKEELNLKGKIILFLIGLLGSVITISILFYLKDKNPILDGITTFLSILGMYLTVKRYIEQWIIWMFVNGLSFLMWLIIVLESSKFYSTLFMWGIYCVLAIYFYIKWKKEISCKKIIRGIKYKRSKEIW